MKVWKEISQETDSRLEIEIDAKKFTIIKVDSEYYGIESVCPHSGGPLGLGDIEDTSIKCPWHGFIFSLRDGSCEDDPCHAAETLNLKVEMGKLWALVDSNQEIKTVHVENLNLQEYSDDIINDPITLIDWARSILGTSNARDKVLMTQKVLELWENGKISEIGKSVNLITVPKRDKVTEYKKVGKRGNAGTLESRIAIIHALANIEQWAIDLGWDIIIRFGEFMPKEFSQEFMKLAADEARHFTLLENRLKELGSHFGALMVHGSLWDSALDTRDDVLARLAIVHMVHEGRGLDVNPKTIDKFKKVGDLLTVEKLEIIHADEITHVALGQKWFTKICMERGLNQYETFHELVRKHYRGLLKPPFNKEDRLKAGLDPNFYLPLSVAHGEPVDR